MQCMLSEVKLVTEVELSVLLVSSTFVATVFGN